MEEKKNRRITDANREKHGGKKIIPEKKTKSDTTTFVTGSTPSIQPLENAVVVGKSCLPVKSRSHESGYKLHECRSETSLSKQWKDVGPSEGQLLTSVPTLSNTSFISAKSDVSNCDTLQKRIHELEEVLHNKNSTLELLKKQLPDNQNVEFNSVSTETDMASGDIKDYASKLKDMEKKIISKDKKINDLLEKLDECYKARDSEVEKNKGLKYEVGLLNRQLQSLYELVGKKNWNKSINSTEFIRLKNKTIELEGMIQKQDSDQRELRKTLNRMSSNLENKERELNNKARELIEYKNRSTLEMCKLINQIDSLKKDSSKRVHVMESKLTEAQNSMDEEIVSITQKLEEQYQKDLKSALEKFRSDFERLAQLPETAIDRLLQFCEPSQIDFISFQKEWDRHQTLLESKILTLQSDHNREMTHLKDSYESKVVFLKTQIESLASQLKERKEILDLFENELRLYKSNSSMNLLRASSKADDMNSLKELYTAELSSQKQVHKLEMNIFEQKVKTLSEEILYRAKNEEIQLQELEYAKKMAFTFREKYEQLVLEWEGKVKREFQADSLEKDSENKSELESVFEEFRNVIGSLKEGENVHEKRLKKLHLSYADEIAVYRHDIEMFKNKLQQLEVFQNTQSKLDETIQELISNISTNYTKTVEALLTSHISELNLRQMEECNIRKRHSKEISSLKEIQSQELMELRNKLKSLEESKFKMEKELTSLKEGCFCKDVKALKEKADEVSLELVKYEGMMAMKDETEEILRERINELENLIKVKEENCKAELEDLLAKFLEVEVMSSAKDDLTKELEGQLNDSETLLEKSFSVLDVLYQHFSTSEENLLIMESSYKNVKGDFKEETNMSATYLMAKTKSEQLRKGFIEAFEEIEFLEDINKSLKQNEIIKANEAEFFQKSMNSALEKCRLLEEERDRVLDENNNLKAEIESLSEDIAEKLITEMGASLKESPTSTEKIRQKLEELVAERRELIRREESVSVERDEILKRNEILEQNVSVLNERINMLVAELTNNKGLGREETYSISMQEVRVMYQEETSEEIEKNVSTVSCQVSLPVSESLEILKYTEDYEDLCKMNEELKKENENLKGEMIEEDEESRFSLQEVISRCRDLENELSEVLNERKEFHRISENLKKERDNLKEELEKLKKIVYKDNDTKMLMEKEELDEDAAVKEQKIKELKGEMGRLSEYIKALTKKLEQMKVSNESLMSESTEQLKHNQKLIFELEEAWSQRYEIEDQLAKVRRENTLLNMHRNQLQATNQRITNLVTEGKPSVASWVKIHETVENIVDEVSALKTSLCESASTSHCSPTGFEVPETKSNLKLLTETLHAQLKNKTVLCDELLVQKRNLEKELEELENLLKENDLRIFSQTELSKQITNGNFDVKMRQLIKKQSNSLVKRPSYQVDRRIQNVEESSDTHLMNLNRLKKHLEHQVELEETQFQESLEIEIKSLKKEMQNLKDSTNDRGNSLGDTVTDEERKNLSLIEGKYEEAVLELTKEFEREVEKLREVFSRESENEKTQEAQEKYIIEIENLRLYFERKWGELKSRYQNIYSSQNQVRLNCALDNERDQIMSQFQRISQEEETKENFKNLESFLNEVLDRYIEEIKFLHEKHKHVLNNLEAKHVAEAQRLHLIIYQLQEGFEIAFKKGEKGEEGHKEVEEKYDADIESVPAEYEGRLEKEKKKLNDLLEEEKQKHEKEMLDLEEFWTEKLSECETKCAILRATTKETKTQEKMEVDDEGNFKKKSENQSDDGQKSFTSEEVNKVEDHYIDKYSKVVPGYNGVHYNQKSGLKLEESKISDDSFCASCLSNQTYFGRMEVKTDDDKLEIVRERDALKEMVSSLRHILAKLLSLVGQYGKDVSNSTLRDFDNEETFYKTIQIDLEHSTADLSTASSNVLLALDVSSIIQEINDNSLFNSSDQIRVELDRCLKQLKKDATGLLALSHPDTPAERQLFEIVKRIEKEKNDLEDKVRKVEEAHDELKKEIKATKERLSQWERNLEVVSEGYGEEVVEPKNIISLSELKDKLKLFMSDHCAQPSQEMNLLEEICKEGDRLQEDWKKEKFDLQQQINVADKQLHSLRKFLEEQAVEREQEREMFDKEINKLQECLKARERDTSLQNRTNREVETLETQMKELNERLAESEKNKKSVESEFQNAVKKIWSLREVIQDLEVQLAEVSEKESNLKKTSDKLEALVDEQSRVNKDLKEELELCKNQSEAKYTDLIKKQEEELITLRHLAEQVNPETLTQMKSSLRNIEATLIKKTKDLEQMHVSSANVSCSSPSEDVSIRDHLDVTRCSTPDEMGSRNQPQNMILPLEEFDRIHEKLARHTRAEEAAMKCIQDLKMQLRNSRKAFEEVQTERDVLLEKVDGFLKENSSLKVRLEEQRCNAGLLQKQLNADLESQINRLEIDVDKLNDLCCQKDKQLKDMQVILENTTKSLKMRESEVLNKSKEENSLVIALKSDLAHALNEKEKLQESVEKMKDKLRERLSMPALMESMIEEKNAEIDRLEKEVLRLSSKRSSVSLTGSNPPKHTKQLRFSEPDSFGDCISSISVQNPSIQRNFSDSFGDMRNSSFKLRQHFQSFSSKPESISSIGPLQLSPRGKDFCLSWKTSSPIVWNQNLTKTTEENKDFEAILQESKLQSEIQSKQREISELKLEIDKLKRQLVEVNQELEAAKIQSKEMQNEVVSREEEIRKLQNCEKSLLMTIESLKESHLEEVEELQNKLRFEHGKVKKVYEEIKALEVKKIEIEEAFLSLKNEYNEKLSGEQKMVDTLIDQIKDLEAKNAESVDKMGTMKKEMENRVKESIEESETLTKEITDLKNENKNLKEMYVKLSSSSKSLADAETQVEGDEKECSKCQNNLALALEMTKVEDDLNPLKDNLNKVRREVDQMVEGISQQSLDKDEVLSCLTSLRFLLSSLLENVQELYQELEAHRKKVMECSVDDLAIKVQRELLLSAKLDNKLLSSIEANGFVSKDQQESSELYESGGRHGGGDNIFVTSRKTEINENMIQVLKMYKELEKKLTDLESEKDDLEAKTMEQEKIIKLLEECLLKEKERLLEEKERCCEDAKIMELLRITLEKGLGDLKAKEKDLKKERQKRLALEKEIESLKKFSDESDGGQKVAGLNGQRESQKEKVMSLNRVVEEEKKKNQELRLLLEQNKIERISEKGAQKLMESELALIREQKENLKDELINARKLLHSRNVEIGLLKRKISLLEIDIKALNFTNELHSQNMSEVSSSRSESLDDGSIKHYPKELTNLRGETSPSFLLKMKKLNSCVQRHVEESNNMGEALLYLSQETEQMRDFIKKLEVSTETKQEDETLVPDLEVEKKLWALERGRLVLDMDTLKEENQAFKQESNETYKTIEILKLENSRMKSQIQSLKKEISNQIETGVLKDRVTHLINKYSRAESYRKALAWQKQYLLITLSGYQRSEEEACKKLGRLGNKKKESRGRGRRCCGRFRVVALAITAVFRMRYIVKRWQRCRMTGVCSLVGLQAQSDNNRQNLLASVLNIYNEPVNPLSYQTQNIIRRSSSSKVLRTPPSRDPGLGKYSLDSKAVPDYLDAFNYLPEKAGTAKVLP